jgi:hypothetical protein
MSEIKSEKKTLAKWIDKNKLDKKLLSTNINAIDFLKENPEFINFTSLSKNPKAINILIENIDKINWYSLSENEAAIDILIQYPENIYWINFCSNKGIFNHNMQNIEELLIKYLESSPERTVKLCCSKLSANPNAVDFLG